ncbi:hypothetical protein D1872_279690 [compost metagenome]
MPLSPKVPLCITKITFYCSVKMGEFAFLGLHSELQRSQTIGSLEAGYEVGHILKPDLIGNRFYWLRGRLQQVGCHLDSLGC